MHIDSALKLHTTKMSLATLLKPEIVCPKKKKITFINEFKRQKIKSFTTADIECCGADVTTNSNKNVIAEHIPISLGYIFK